MRALVVDDYADAAELMAYEMNARGFEATAAASVRAAKLVLASTAIDLVLTDYCMPEEDGLALVRFCARAHPDLPVVVVTGRDCDELAAEAFDAGAFDLLQKPVSPIHLDRLVAMVRQAGRQPARQPPAVPRHRSRPGTYLSTLPMTEGKDPCAQ